MPYNTGSDTGNLLNTHSRSEAGLKTMTLVQGSLIPLRVQNNSTLEISNPPLNKI
jgi:hypothetical protein